MFLYLIALKSWGIFREEEEEEDILRLSEENLFFIIRFTGHVGHKSVVNHVDRASRGLEKAR
jgi:hypothetical protein